MENTYMAFPASEQLAGSIALFIEQANQQPGVIHLTSLDKAVQEFIDEMLHAFFTQPVNVLGAEGGMVSLINSIANIVSKASRSLAVRLLSKINADEQSRLLGHFEAIRIVVGEETRIGFPLIPSFAEQADRVLNAALDGDTSHSELLGVMHRITEHAIQTFLDEGVNQLELGRLARGIVATARATIRKASNSATDRLMGLPTHQRRPVIEYFISLMVQTRP